MAESRDYWGSEKQPYYHPGPNPSVDIVLCHRDCVLLIQRGKEPHLAAWALPGGFHETDALPGQPWRPGRESAQEAALRELAEETGISPDLAKENIQSLGIFDRFGRDPRDNDQAWSVSQVFMVTLRDDLKVDPQAGSDARVTGWFSAEQLADIDLAFDHRDMIILAWSLFVNK